MEVVESAASPEGDSSITSTSSFVGSRQEEILYTKLKSFSSDRFKYESVALTMEALFKDNLTSLVRLFDFYKSNQRIDLAYNLCTNQLLKNFDLTKPNVFDDELFRFARALAASQPSSSSSSSSQLKNYDDEFYSAVFDRLPSQFQQKFLSTILDRLKTGQLGFLKSFSSPGGGEEKAGARPALTAIELADFYESLGKNKDYLMLARDLLVRRPSFIHDYGLNLIDAFLNLEKHAFVVSSLVEIERRSLNVMRRVSVVELIPEFVNLIDKLENRHCYRWIEKSLEFYTKYTIAAIRATNKLDRPFIYVPISIINDNESSSSSSSPGSDTKAREEISKLKSSLGNLAEYAFTPSESQPSPFYAIYTLLDELSKKLDWPSIPGAPTQPQTQIELKMSRLFEFKSKTDPTSKTVSISSLNKQISFYGLAFFFQKLIEFHSAARECFGTTSTGGLVMAPLFEIGSQHALSLLDAASTTSSSAASHRPIQIEYTESSTSLSERRCVFNACLESLVCSLELWRKFNQHKEWMTIISKCLNNSKLDSIGLYKSFISDYYWSYQLLTTQNAIQLNWSSLTTSGNNQTVSLKRRVSLIAYLFIQEKTSFKNFFTELNRLLSELKESPNNDEETTFNASLSFFKSNFDLFEPTKTNMVRYFSKLIGEKLNQLFEAKKSVITTLLNKNDKNIWMMLVLLQPSLRRASNASIYQSLFQLLLAKSSFSWPEFFDYVYDIQILEDFYMMLNSSSSSSSSSSIQLGGESSTRESALQRIFEQINTNNADKLRRVSQFVEANLNDLVGLFDQFV